MPKTVLAFDLYGTLLSTNAISDALSQYCEASVANTIAPIWRKYQLEYTWRLNSMRQYEDFESVTRKSLQHTLLENDIELDGNAIDSIMKAYDTLSAFPDVIPALEKLRSTSAVDCVVFSNGTKRMIQSSMAGSEGLSTRSDIFSKIISVDHVMSFKPAPAAYRYLVRCLEPATEQDVRLISSNPFDVVGAQAVGIKAIWVDRAGKGWQDRLSAEPHQIIHSLEELPDIFSSQAPKQ